MLSTGGQYPDVDIDWGSLRGEVERRMQAKWSDIPAAAIEDEAQEAIIIVRQKIVEGETVRGKTIDSPLALATDIAHKKLCDRRRRLCREEELGEEKAESLPSESISVEDEVEAHMTVQAIMDCLPLMSKNQREVFILSYSEQMSHAQISLETGLSIASIKVNLQRARDKVRDRLSPSD